MRLSIVSPVYRGEQQVDELVQRIALSVSDITSDYEIILVEDGSPDSSWGLIEAACKQSDMVKGIRLSRNFGQHYAITAGLEAATGDWVVVMDCDLQDRPEEIPKLYERTKDGYDMVLARREVRQDSALKRLSSKLFYRVFGYLTDSKQDSSIANFGIYHQKVITSILSMKDHIRYFPTMVQWVGFSSTTLNVQHDGRDGESSYSWGKLIGLALDNIVAFSDKPLRLLVKMGFVISLGSFCVGIYFLIKYLAGDIKVLGFTSVIISIWFLSGLIIFMLGVVGVYIAKTFDRVKERPVFIIDEKLNL